MLKISFHSLSSLLVYTWLLTCLFSGHNTFSQNGAIHKLQPFINPYILKMGDLSSQYSTLTNDLLPVEYNTPVMFQVGINYVQTYNEWSLITGVSHMIQQHGFTMSFPNPYEGEYTLSSLTQTLFFSSNFLVLKVGASHRLYRRLSINLELNYFLSVTRQNRIKKYELPYNPLEWFDFVSNYELETPEGVESVRTQINSNRFEQKYKPFILPEISVDYALSSNVLINLGFRAQFWSNPDNYRFDFEVDGYLHSSNENEEVKPLHRSRITPQGYYLWLGLKYEIPILTNQKSTE